MSSSCRAQIGKRGQEKSRARRQAKPTDKQIEETSRAKKLAELKDKRSQEIDRGKGKGKRQAKVREKRSQKTSGDKQRKKKKPKFRRCRRKRKSRLFFGDLIPSTGPPKYHICPVQSVYDTLGSPYWVSTISFLTLTSLCQALISSAQIFCFGSCHPRFFLGRHRSILVSGAKSRFGLVV